MPKSATSVEEIIARCLLEPRFLEQIANNPVSTARIYDLPEETGIKFEGFDFDALREFSGFVEKIQHNHLWDVFPATRSLLRALQAEHRTFADYRMRKHSVSGKPQSANDKVAAFASYLVDRYARDADYPGLACILRWELSQWKVVQRVTAEKHLLGLSLDELTSMPWEKFERLKIARRQFCIESFDCDAGESAAHALEGRYVHCASSKSRYFVFSVSAKQIFSHEVDDLSASLLLSVNAEDEVRAVALRARERLPGAISAESFRGFFEYAFGLGWLCASR